MKEKLEKLYNYKIAVPLIFLVILVVSFLMRSYNITEESLYRDEPYSLFNAQKSFADLKEIFLHDQNPPLHISLLHYWYYLFGLSDVSSKMFSVVCSVLAGFILFMFSKKYLNKETAFLAFFLYLFSTSQQIFSIEVRPYALVQLLCIASFWVYFHILTNPKKKDIFFLMIINFLLLFTHYLSIFSLVVQFLFIWFFYKKNKKGFYYYFISQILLLAAFAPWIAVLLSNIPQEGTFWNHAPNYGEFRWNLEFLVGGERLFNVFNGLVLVSIILIVINKFRKILISNFDLRYYFIFLSLYIIPIILDLIVSQKTPVFLARYILYSTIGLFLTIGYIYSCIEIKKLYKYILVIPLLYIVFSSFHIIVDREDDWKRMVPVVKSKMDNNTAVLICASYMFQSFTYYYDIDIFKDYKRCQELLAKRNIFYNAGGLYGWNDFNFKKVSKVIYVHSHHQFEDPEQRIEDFIESKGFKNCVNYYRGNTGYKIYLRDSLECNPIRPFSEIPGNPCDLVKGFIGINSSQDTVTIYKSNFENYKECNYSDKVIDKRNEGGKVFYMVNEKCQYGPGISKPLSEFKDDRIIYIEANLINETDEKGDLVVTVEHKGKLLFRNDFMLNLQFQTKGKNEKLSVEATIPSDLPPGAQLGIYFWNPTKGNLLIENFSILFHK